MINPQVQAAGVPTQFQPGQSGNPNGRPKGSKNWSTIVQDLLFDEDFVGRVEGLMSKKNPIWDKVPNKNFANIIVSSMLLKASGGDKQAAEWLRKTGFGDKLDITTDGESLAGSGTASQEKAEQFSAFLAAQAHQPETQPETRPATALPVTPPVIPPAPTPTQPVPQPIPQPTVTPPAPAAPAAPAPSQAIAPTMPTTQPVAPQPAQGQVGNAA